METQKVIPLYFLSEGERGTVKNLKGGKTFQEKMTAMGINRGTEIEVISGTTGQPFLILAGETRLALGLGLTQKIEIEKNYGGKK